MRQLLVAALLILAACTEDDKKPEVPQDWVNLIFDIQTARISVERASPDDRDSLGDEYHRQILEIHDMSQSDYDRMTDYLYAHPSVMDSIYLSVNRMIDSLKRASRKN